MTEQYDLDTICMACKTHAYCDRYEGEYLDDDHKVYLCAQCKKKLDLDGPKNKYKGLD